MTPEYVDWTDGSLRRDGGLLAVIVAVELALLGGYFAATPSELISPLLAVVPFVWVDVGLWAVLRVDPPVAPRMQRWGAAAVAGVYLVVLLWLAGLVGIVTRADAFTAGLHVGLGSPGWERIVYVSPPVYVAVLPYRVVGYLVLAYLVYVTLLETARNVVAGAVGLVSCVSCSFPIVASLIAGAVGGAAGFQTIYAHSVELSTLAYLLAVGLLYWRPSLGGLRNLLA